MLKETVDKLKSLLMGRKVAYCNVFNKESQLALVVLKDLSKFCRADESTFHPDPRVHAVLEGRREVWLRIQQHLNLSPDELFNIYARKDS